MTPVQAHARLLADVGGTHARFALEQVDGRITGARVLRVADYPDPLTAIRAYLALEAAPSPSRAGIAIATPIDGDAVRMTNHGWAFSITALRDALGLERLLVLNDFTALALALPTLTDAERVAIGGGTAQPEATLGLLGPGTGLGVSGLVRCGPRWQPLASEGGHVTLAAGSAEEAALIETVRGDYPHVSAERLLSGPGLVLIHDALRRMRGLPSRRLTPAELAAEAQTGRCTICVDAAARFSALLGSVAGNLALTLGSRGGVYLGGGVIAGLGPAFDRAGFRARFEAKGRFRDWLAAIPTFEIRAEHPALRGVAVALGDDAPI